MTRGAAKRTSTREGLEAERAALLALPVSPDRATALRRVRSRLKNLLRRSERCD